MAREQMKAREDEETSLLDRRSYLKLAGSAVAATAASSGVGGAETDTVGYGEGGYGQSPYGGSSDSTDTVPTIDEFTVSKSDQLGDDRMFSVRWGVSDDGEDLDTVEVVVVDAAADMNFAVSDVSGASASGWNLFQFPIGSTIDVTVRVEDSAGNVSKETKTVTL